MAALRIELLGGFAARLEDGAALALKGRKTQALVAVLALTSGESHRRDSARCAGLHCGVPNGGRVFGVTEYFVTEFAGVASARYDNRRAVFVAQPPDCKAKPFNFAKRRLMRRRPYYVRENVAAFRALHRKIVQLI